MDQSPSLSTRWVSWRCPLIIAPSMVDMPRCSCVTSRMSLRHATGLLSSKTIDTIQSPLMSQRPLRVRWLGRVRYRDAHALQRALFRSDDDYLLLIEHPHVYTRGVRTKPEHLLEDVEKLGADLVDTDRGGDLSLIHISEPTRQAEISYA